MSVVAMKASMPQKEFNGWVLYLSEKGPDIEEIQLAVLSTLVSQGLGGKSKVEDFILSKVQEPKKTNEVMSASDISAVFSAVSTVKQ